MKVKQAYKVIELGKLINKLSFEDKDCDPPSMPGIES